MNNYNFITEEAKLITPIINFIHILSNARTAMRAQKYADGSNILLGSGEWCIV